MKKPDQDPIHTKRPSKTGAVHAASAVVLDGAIVAPASEESKFVKSVEHTYNTYCCENKTPSGLSGEKDENELSDHTQCCSGSNRPNHITQPMKC